MSVPRISNPAPSAATSPASSPKLSRGAAQNFAHAMAVPDDCKKPQQFVKAVEDLQKRTWMEEETLPVLLKTIMQVAFVALGIAQPHLMLVAVALYMLLLLPLSLMSVRKDFENWGITDKEKMQLDLYTRIALTAVAFVPGGSLIFHVSELATRKGRIEAALEFIRDNDAYGPFLSQGQEMGDIASRS